MKFYFFEDTKIGPISIASENKFITNLSFSKNIKNANLQKTPEIKEAFEQLLDYLEGKRKSFNLNLKPKGTDFQLKVWKELLNIEYGKTATYKDIAKYIGNINASRAVGSANNKNPIPIFIPCHRIISSNGTLSGYLAGLNIKKLLLNIEKQSNLSNS